MPFSTPTFHREPLSCSPTLEFFQLHCIERKLV